jgi:hypothetical protein
MKRGREKEENVKEKGRKEKEKGRKWKRKRKGEVKGQNKFKIGKN